MGNVIPLKAKYTGSTPTSIGEVQTGDNVVVPNLQVSGAAILNAATPMDTANVAVATNYFLFIIAQMILTGTEETVLSGTGRVVLTDLGLFSPFLITDFRTPVTSFTVPTESFLDQISQLRMPGIIRMTMKGTGVMFLHDLMPTLNRLTLSGKGGQ
jgi:hypothetical protein